MRSRMPTSISSGAIARCIPISDRRPTAFRTWASAGPKPRTPVAFVAYGDESDTGFRGQTGYPIPDVAKTQPNFIEGGVPGGGSDGDRHMLIVDRDRWVLYELYADQLESGPRTMGSRVGRDLRSLGQRTTS